MRSIYAAFIFFFFINFSFGQYALCDGVTFQTASVTDGTRTLTFDFNCITSTYDVTMVGPDNEWVGILFGSSMNAGSNALIYATESDVGAIRSYYVNGYSLPVGTTNYELPTISDDTNAGIRTVTAGPRAFDTGDSQEITFSTSTTSVLVRIAYHGGGNLDLSQHQVTGSSFIFTFLILNPGTLPLDFLDFDLQLVGKGVEVNWTVDNVINVDKMVVQRSVDGKSWEDLSALEITSSKHYTYADQNPYPASNYYRIKVVDLDGSEKYSKVTTIIMPVNQFKEDVVTFAPNPFQDDLNILVSESYDKSELIQLTITDASFGLEYQRTMTLEHLEQLDLSFLSAGTHYVVVVHSDWIQKGRLIKI